MQLLMAAGGSPPPQTLVWMRSPKENNVSCQPRTRQQNQTRTTVYSGF